MKGEKYLKVSTELKNVIKRSFEEKKKTLRKDMERQNEESYQKKLKELEDSKEFKAYVKAYKALEEKFYDEKFNIHNSEESWYVSFHEPHSDSFIEKKYWSKRDSLIEKEMTKLEQEKETLLIKLTYEKDFEEIKKMLAEYEIYL